MEKEREQLIGTRLRKFREMLQIPRTKFAVSIGFGSERIASYETGRARLRYDVFRAMTQRYYISPRWLANEFGIPVFPAPFKDDFLLPLIKPGALFSDVYDTHLAARLESNAFEAEFRLDVIEKQLSTALAEFWDDSTAPLIEKEKAAKRLMVPFKTELAMVDRELRLRKRVSESTSKISDLTFPATSVKNLEVKLQLPTLLERLNRATKETGKMSALAKYLEVPLASVSRWLSGKREPGGEITLKMLRWVEQPERRPEP